MASKVENRRLITYGVNPQAEVRALNIGFGAEGSTFDVLISAPDGADHRARRDHACRWPASTTC